jgi:hypothetical protein
METTMNNVTGAAIIHGLEVAITNPANSMVGGDIVFVRFHVVPKVVLLLIF